ncbi:MAG: Seryl-tRNA synthetase [Ktedonobacterales bacterium]|jgi:seryl-tRNA synthetase|nr:MAG: Seryl-tRNA synthetase [Ktedonobacterales bacterium]
MLNERYLRDHPDNVRAAFHRRHAGAEAVRTFDAWLALDARRRAAAAQRDALAAAIRASGNTRPTEEARTASRELQTATDALAKLEDQARGILLQLPNLPAARVPDGDGPADNVELRRWGQPRAFDFTPRPHDALATALGIYDAPRATKLAGPRFPLLLGAGARLARALAALMLELHAERGYTEVAPPHLLRAETLEGAGHLPRHADDLYTLLRDGLYLSPTAEAQLVALHAGETLPEARLPLAYTACTPAFRREAGSSRAATHGLIRQHQFDKVELVRIATPDTAHIAFDTVLADAEAVLQRLELPYRVVALCAGELPFASQYTCDLEVWMPGQGRYVEISSVSDCGTFQARRLNLRYKPAAAGRARYPHTLNGSALAIGRTLAAILENGQRADGSVTLPPALSAPWWPPAP